VSNPFQPFSGGGGGGGGGLTKAEHGALAPTEYIHTTISLIFADAAARNGYGAVADDVGKIAQQTDTGDLFILEDTAPTWVQIGGGGGVTSHLGLTNLTDAPDAGHTQLVVLAGRAGGQDVAGGTGAGEDLQLRSTTDGTKGTILADSTISVTGDVIATGEGVFGDVVLSAPVRNARWRIKEFHTHITVANEVTGLTYRMMLEPDSVAKRGLLALARLTITAVILYAILQFVS
jgi:hypothetical protein